jgi:hypothetical protein
MSAGGLYPDAFLTHEGIVSKRHDLLEKDDAQADPTGFSGKADTAG